MTTREKAQAAVQQMSAAMEILQSIMLDPSADVFESVAESFEELETVLAAKAALDAAFAYSADQAAAGRRVGSARTLEYLIQKLKLSKREALLRLRTGESLYGPPPPPPTPDPEPEPVDPAAAAEEEERRRQAQKAARDQAAARSAEILRIIEDELRHLNPTCQPSREEIYREAVAAGEKRTPEDLRTWLRRRVAQANKAGVKDPLAAYRKRHIGLSDPDEDGGRRLYGYLPAADAALLAAIMANGEHSGANLPPDTPETRSLSQRRLDELIRSLQNVSATRQSASRYGVGSVLFSVTAEDIENLSADSVFTTNTGDELTPVDLLRLGAAQYDVLVLHDADGQPLALGRGHRLASFWQRIALLAAEGVCTCGDCTTAGVHLHIHHLRPWEDGGTTDLSNLTGICPPHHADNDDTRTGIGGRGWMVRCPSTGRVGRRAGPGQPIIFNETQAAAESNGARIRRREAA
ncbi:HNH endonuclease signature motif containing protein [Corynebacterium sp.]|uniref:HNH endonuclease signature motif containing protein n=1 Tax=Corynebacterium sp. TaxID=1720 RepID=UPI0026E075A1|nr:HNH endonuclease signature motif containing protein [Corynebacterium sp.]MDO5512472.1 DUF222 domain-containing protein [Corynebacterium sp.]